MRRVALIAIVLLAAVPATARADGLPAVGVDAHPLALPEGDVAYITHGSSHGTRLIEHARYGGPVRERRLRGWFSIPAVAYDGSPSGLTADGRKLILISPRKRFPRRRTTFAVVDTRTLTGAPPHRAAGRLQLRRDLPRRPDDVPDPVLVPGDVLNYAVRAYDLRAGRMLRAPVVDPEGARRGHEENPGHAHRGRGRPLGVHAVRQRQALVRARPRHLPPDRRMHRPGHQKGLGRAARAAWRPARCDGKGRSTAGEHRHRHTHGDPPAARDREHRGPRTRSEDASTSWLPLAVPTALLLIIAAALHRRRGLKNVPPEPITEARRGPMWRG